MSDKKITIGIETTANTAGAQQATAAIDDMADKARELDAALDQVGSPALGAGAGLPAIPAQAKKAAAEIKDVRNESARLGKGGDGGRAVLEFSRAFEDAQYGIRGVLNNLPGLIAALGGGAGLAGVISVVAVTGSVLWEQFSKGAKDAAGPTIDFMEIFKKLAKEFGNVDLEIEKARGTGADANLAKQKQYVDNQDRIAKNELELEKKRIKADAGVAVAQARLDLARQESELATASGERAAKLAKEREATLLRIVELERQALEAVRQAEERAAVGKVASARDNLSSAEDARVNLRDRASEKSAELAAANNELANSTLERLKTVETLTGLRDDARKGKASSINPVEIAAFSEQANDLSKKIDTLLDTPTRFEAAATVARDDAAAASKQAQDNFEKASKDQREAAEKLKLAAQDLDNLRRSQGLDRQSETGLQRISEASAADQKIKGEKDSVVGQLDSLVGSIGESGGKDLAPFITEMKSILQDKSLSADELARLPTLLSQYFGKIANLGNAQNSAIRDAMGQVDSLMRDVANLKAASAQKNP